MHANNVHIINCNLIFFLFTSAEKKFSLVRVILWMKNEMKDWFCSTRHATMEVGDEVCVSHDLSDFRIDLVLLLFYEHSFIHVFFSPPRLIPFFLLLLLSCTICDKEIYCNEIVRIGIAKKFNLSAFFN